MKFLAVQNSSRANGRLLLLVALLYLRLGGKGAAGCMDKNCEWPIDESTDANEICYRIPPGDCRKVKFAEQSRKALYFQTFREGSNDEWSQYTLSVPIDQIYTRDVRYPANTGCTWTFPYLEPSCEQYIVVIHELDLDQAKHSPGSRPDQSCDCADHIFIECIQNWSLCFNSEQNSQPGNKKIKLHPCFGKLVIKFRSDQSGSASGFHHIVVENNSYACGEEVSGQKQVHSEVFEDLVDIPYLVTCPPFTKARLHKAMLECIDKTLTSKKDQSFTEDSSGKSQHVQSKILGPPTSQCYCNGMCSASSEKERSDFIESFCDGGCFEIGFLNSPDLSLRKAARQAWASNLRCK